MTHTATVLSAARTIDIIDRTLPDAIPTGHVRLRLATGSLCGTDLHYFHHFSNAGFEMRNPVSLGHEACAYVLDPNGSGLTPGALVALSPIINCGTCPACLRGQENHCQNKKFPGSATTVPHIDGFFQQEFDFPAACCHPTPDGANPAHVTFTEPLACSMHAVTKTGIGSGDRLLVTGCGPMGLLAVLAARSRGIDVDVSDVKPEAVQLGRAIGADRGFVLGETAPEVECYDAVIEASGSIDALNTGLEVLRRCGTLVILSNIQPTQISAHLHLIMLREIAVVGSFQFNKEFRQALELTCSNPPELEKLIASRFALPDLAAALEYMLAGKAAGKILIEPNG